MKSLKEEPVIFWRPELAVAYKKGWVGQDVMVHMPGGKLWIQIDENWNLKMTGSVESIGSVKLTKEFEKKLGF